MWSDIPKTRKRKIEKKKIQVNILSCVCVCMSCFSSFVLAYIDLLKTGSLDNAI